MTTDPPPPVDLGARILERARAARTPGRPVGLGPTPTGPQLYRSMTDRLGDLLAGLAPAEWRAIVRPYGWTVQGLVGHVLAADRHTVDVHRPGTEAAAGLDHVTMTLDTVTAETDRQPAETLADWQQASADVVALRGGAEVVAFHGASLTSEAVLVIRAFEVWTHTDDIRRALGRPTADPDAEEVRRMSEQSLAIAAPRRGDPAIRLVLTGAGGGTWQLGTPTEPGAEAARVVVDAVDYCRFAARRLGRDDLQVDITGDHAPVERFLDVARSMAV